MNQPTYLTRDAILGAKDIHTEEVDVPEWGGVVRVRGMSGRERDEFEASLLEEPAGNRQQRRQKRKQKETNLANIRAKMCAWCIVDEAGGRLFSDQDIVALGGKSAAALDRVFDVAQRMSGFDEEDIDEIAEKMVEDPFDGSSSASPEN